MEVRYLLKMKIFMWQVWLNEFFYREEQRRIGIQVEGKCLLCGIGSENIDYIFNFCERVQDVWKKVKELDWIKEELFDNIIRWIRNLTVNGSI